MSNFDPTSLIKLCTMKMPFGKYQGVKLIDLPESYVLWFYDKGLPAGELGQLIGELYEIKVNGLEPLVRSISFSDDQVL